MVIIIAPCTCCLPNYRRIQPLLVPCTWKELKDGLNEIDVGDPNEDFLRSTITYTAGGTFKLLYYYKFLYSGYFSVFIEQTKSVEMGRIMYDPMTGKHVTYSQSQLEKFVRYNIYFHYEV